MRETLCSMGDRLMGESLQGWAAVSQRGCEWRLHACERE